MSAPFARFLGSLIIGLACARPAQAQDFPANALGVLNAYLIQAAQSDPADRADIKAGDGQPPLPGHFLGYSSFLGSFSYRPKTYGELARSDRAALLRDPAFRDFLAARRRPEARPESSGRPPVAPARLRQFSITAEELLGRQATLVTLPPP